MGELEKIFTAAQQRLQSGEKAVFTAILETRGSAPRTTGALMVSGGGKLLAGTVGGGPLEHFCIGEADKLGKTGEIRQFRLDHSKAGELGMVCGGSAKVLFTPVQSEELLTEGLALLKSRTPGWMALPLDGSAPYLIKEGNLPRCAAVCPEENALVLPLLEAGRVFLIGGGHVAAELAAILHQLEIRYLVVDDRPEFSSPDRFPGAEETFTLPLDKLADHLTGSLCPTREDAVCIMTRGHGSDTEAARFALSTSAGYIGVMGSRRKRAAMFDALEKVSCSDYAQRITSPIGLAIGAQTPAEIAVSIAAQLIQWRASHMVQD